MIVSCESCKSRYKLDDSKVTGRGAKITCPKCKHVFVVFAAGSTPTPPARPKVADEDDGDDEGPTRIGGPTGRPPGAPVNTVSFGDAGGGPMASAIPASRANPTLAVPLPDLRAPDSHVVGHSPPPPPPPVTSVTPSEGPGRASALDFKKVGVATWKVKVRIGLIYDFSDIKTLRKYITDGRVTPADVISHDGKTWKPIGEIPDLDAFFVETFERLQAERGNAPPPEPRMPEPRVAPPVVEDTRAEPEPSQYRDPFDDLRSRQRDRMAKRGAPVPDGAAKGSSGSRATPILLGLLGAAVIGGGLWYVSSVGGTVNKPATTPPVKAEAAKTVRDQEREDIQKKLKQQFAEVPAAPTPGADPAADVPLDPVATDPGVKVLDDGRVVRIKAGPSGGTTTTSGGGERSPISATPSSTIKVADISATDHEAAGDGAAKSRDWAGAAKAYQNAVNLDPGSGRLLKKLGDAQYRSGQLDAAQATLQAAAGKGQKDALKLLGAIAREQGDVSQANALYQQYLATGPKDAADVEKILKEMNGG